MEKHMEINEKLDIFYRAAIAAAKEQSTGILESQERINSENLALYEKKKEEEYQMRVRTGEEAVRKEINRSTSEQILAEKRRLYEEQEKRKEELFALVEQKISDFRRTAEYRSQLLDSIRRACRYADGAEITVYLDPADASLVEGLAQETGCTLAVSDETFGGGIRAVIPDKNVLIDESFGEKLKREREEFSFGKM